jgi:hypothetical protein
MKEQSHTECFIIEARLNDNRLKMYEKIDIKMRYLVSSDAILKILFFLFGSVRFSLNFEKPKPCPSLIGVKKVDSAGHYCGPIPWSSSKKNTSVSESAERYPIL